MLYRVAPCHPESGAVPSERRGALRVHQTVVWIWIQPSGSLILPSTPPPHTCNTELLTQVSTSLNQSARIVSPHCFATPAVKHFDCRRSKTLSLVACTRHHHTNIHVFHKSISYAYSIHVPFYCFIPVFHSRISETWPLFSCSSVASAGVRD